eukprot:9395635-Lingulodinium_polyedra.AAC.1
MLFCGVCPYFHGAITALAVIPAQRTLARGALCFCRTAAHGIWPRGSHGQERPLARLCQPRLLPRPDAQRCC